MDGRTIRFLALEAEVVREVVQRKAERIIEVTRAFGHNIVVPLQILELQTQQSLFLLSTSQVTHHITSD